MYDIARRIASRIFEHRSDEITILTHIDADGIAAGSIASQALERAGIEHSIEFVKQLDLQELEKLHDSNPELVWFTDIGSGMLQHIEERKLNAVITDHHLPASSLPELDPEARTDLLKLTSALERIAMQGTIQLNPHVIDRNGAYDLSGAGATFMVANALNPDNVDLSPLAVVGAVGDLQDARTGRLTGTNRDILSTAIGAGLIECIIDIRYFGRETRALHRMLRYANDPPVPGVSYDEHACTAFLQELCIEQKEGDHWRRWIDLSIAERRTIISKIVELLLSKGFGSSAAKRVIGEVYLLIKERPGTELHDAKEFSTLLNACGRYGHPEVGYNVCLGDRSEWFARARTLLRGHRRNLVEMVQLVSSMGITQRKHLQYFNGGDKILESVVGVVTGMLLSSGDAEPNKPLFAFAQSDDGINVKVSARCTRELVRKGIDLAEVMREASRGVGGVGGGHNIAAGAHIPAGSEEQFLELSEKIIKRQTA